MMKIARTLRRILGAMAIATLFSHCAGARFNADWDRAVTDQHAGKHDAVTGPWEGNWLSHHNQHTGALRCLVDPVSGSDELYRFRYRATWKNFLSGGFAADYTVKSDGGAGYRVTGEKDLGSFGTFTHDGRIRGNDFEATFRSSSGDHGEFSLKRPE